MLQQIKSLTIEELEAFISDAKIPKFRSMQILSWLYDKNVSSYDNMTNLPKSMREQLASSLPLHVPKLISKLESVDGSRKYLLRFHDGALAETVGMPSNDGRLTVCASSQSGCAMGCVFCATGKAGLTRNLFAGEIVDQITFVQDDFGQRVTNVVVMGQGEPFANYENTIGALRILNHPKLLNMGARHITVSTCGLIEGIRKFSEEPEQFTLAVSLHSANQETRDSIMPAMKNQRLGTLRAALVDYTERTGRRFTFEYALMKGVNDSDKDLAELVKYCRRLLCHVNLIPLNFVEGSQIQPVSTETMNYWREQLESEGIAASVRRSRGSDIDAACGQLAAKMRDEKLPQ